MCYLTEQCLALIFYCPFSLHRLELWPGFATAIQQYEKQIMLCAEVTHKILRTDTVYDFLNDLYGNRPRSFHDDAIKGLVGEIVLTRYMDEGG